MIWKMTNKDLFEALRTFEKEKGIPMDYMLQNIEKAMLIDHIFFYNLVAQNPDALMYWL